MALYILGQIFSTGDGSGSSYTSSYLSASGTLQPVTSVVFAAMTESSKSVRGMVAR